MRKAAPPVLSALLIAISGCLSDTASFHVPPDCRNDCSSMETRHCVFTDGIIDAVFERVAQDSPIHFKDGSKPNRPACLVEHADPQADLFVLFEIELVRKNCAGGDDPQRPVPLSCYEDWLRKEYYEALKGRPINAAEVDAEVRLRARQPRLCLLWAAYGRPDKADAPDLVPRLREALRDRLSGNRALAAAGLGHLEEAAAEAAGDLGQALGDDNPVVRINAAQALWQIHRRPEEALPVLRAELRNATGAPDLAALALGQMGPAAAPAVADLCDAAQARDRYVRAQAMFALGTIRPSGDEAKQAVRRLCACLDDPRNDKQVRVHMVKCGWRGQEHLSFERSVRSYALIALGEMGPAATDALPVLTHFQQDTERWPEDRDAAREAIKRIKARPPALAGRDGADKSVMW